MQRPGVSGVGLGRDQQRERNRDLMRAKSRSRDIYQESSDFGYLGETPYLKLEPSEPHIETSRLITPLLVREGDSAALNIDIHGEPPPRVRWYVGRRLIDVHTHGYLIKESGLLHTFCILAADEEINRGIFVTATNDYGQDQRKLDVKLYKVLTGQRHGRAVRRMRYKSTGDISSRPRRESNVNPGHKSFTAFEGSGTSFRIPDDPRERLNKSAYDLYQTQRVSGGVEVFTSDDYANRNNISYDSGFPDSRAQSLKRHTFSSTDHVFAEVNRKSAAPLTMDFPSQEPFDYSSQRSPRGPQRSPVRDKRKRSSRSQKSNDKPSEDDSLWEISGVKLSKFCEDVLTNYEIEESQISVSGTSPGQHAPGSSVATGIFADTSSSMASPDTSMYNASGSFTAASMVGEVTPKTKKEKKVRKVKKKKVPTATLR